MGRCRDRETVLTESEKKLAMSVYPLVKETVANCRKRSPWMRLQWSFEDQVQDAMIDVMHAARKYDPQRGAFTTMAVKCVTNGIAKQLNFLKSKDRWKHAMEDISFTQEVITHELHDAMPGKMLMQYRASDNVEKQTEERIACGMLMKTMENMPITKRYYVDCKTLEEIGREQSLTKERIRQLKKAEIKAHKDALDKIRYVWEG